jgi:hypothetical protein
MDPIKDTQRIAESWWQFFDYCFNINPASLICEPFWAKFIGIFIATGVLAVLAGVWKYFSYRRKFAAALRAQAERERIDEVEIREASWNGDKAYQSHIPDREVLAQIRAAVDERKRSAEASEPR